MCLPVHSNDVPRLAVVAVVVVVVAVVVAVAVAVVVVAAVVALEEDQVSLEEKKNKTSLSSVPRATATRKKETSLKQVS